MRALAPCAAPAGASHRRAPLHPCAICPSRSAFIASASAAAASPSRDDAAPGWSVFVLKTPLIGLEAAGALLGGAYPAALEHAVALVVAPDGTATAHDFVPQRPTSLLTALRLLTGAGAPGLLRQRPLRLRGALPRRCWRVGPVSQSLFAEAAVVAAGGIHSALSAQNEAAAVAAAVARFDASWPRTLRLRSVDCVAHVEALALALTGVARAVSLDPLKKRRGQG